MTSPERRTKVPDRTKAIALKVEGLDIVRAENLEVLDAM
jgi:hypothetical protein